MDENDDLASANHSKRVFSHDIRDGPAPRLFKPDVRNLQNLDNPANQVFGSENANFGAQAQVFSMLAQQMTKLSSQFEINNLRVEQESIKEKIDKFLKKAEKYKKKVEKSERMVEILKERLLQNDNLIGNLVKKSENDAMEVGNQIIYKFKTSSPSEDQRVREPVENARIINRDQNINSPNKREGLINIEPKKDQVNNAVKLPSDNHAKPSIPIPTGPFSMAPNQPPIQLKSPAVPVVNIPNAQFSNFKPPHFSANPASDKNSESSPIKVASDKNTSGVTQPNDPSKPFENAPQGNQLNQNIYQKPDLNKPGVANPPIIIKDLNTGPFPGAIMNKPPPPPPISNQPIFTPQFIPQPDASGRIQIPSVINIPKPVHQDPVIISNLAKPPTLTNPPDFKIATPPIQPGKPLNNPGGAELPGVAKGSSNPPLGDKGMIPNLIQSKPPPLIGAPRPQDGNSENPNVGNGSDLANEPKSQNKPPGPLVPPPIIPGIMPAIPSPSKNIITPMTQPLNILAKPGMHQPPPTFPNTNPNPNQNQNPNLNLNPIPFPNPNPNINLNQPLAPIPPKQNEIPQPPVLIPPTILSPNIPKANPPASPMPFPGVAPNPQPRPPVLTPSPFPPSQLPNPPKPSSTSAPPLFAPIILPTQANNPLSGMQLKAPPSYMQNANPTDPKGQIVNVPKDFSNITGGN